MILHRLNGCAPAPLAHYLKALGILRIVSEQLDPEARGYWEGDRFVLVSRKNECAIIDFFLNQYAPTPLVSPWNKGSGFFASDAVLRPLEASSAPRFAAIRYGVAQARRHLDELEKADQLVRAIKDETKGKKLEKAARDTLKGSPEHKRRLAEAERRFKELKADLIPNLRLTWRGPHREWMDAAMVLDVDGAASFPSLLGTGGNDGRLDFTNNYFQRLAELFDFTTPLGAPRTPCRTWVAEALFGVPARALVLGVPAGQFAPGVAGGANATSGSGDSARMNPADFVLLLEGSVLFTASSNRRWESDVSFRASAPFVSSGHSAGYASASAAEDGNRGEQWVPLWSGACTLDELRHLLAEGRAQLGSRPAKEPIDLARAVSRLGIARGIQSFQRFGYIERNGQSNFAVPLGRFAVPEQASPKLTCLDDLDAWLPRLRRQARAKEAPARLQQAERRLGDAVFGLTQHPDESSRWQTLLQRLADIEAIQVTGSGYQAGPIPRLRPEWAQVANDGSAEFRLALAFALQAQHFDRKEFTPFRGDTVRRHWVTLKNGWQYATTGSGSQQRLHVKSERVLLGRDGIDDAIRLLSRRLIEASQSGVSQVPLRAARQADASSDDLAQLVAGSVDLDRCISLARALMALDARAWARFPRTTYGPRTGDFPDDAWLAIRLATLPFKLATGVEVKFDTAILRRLEVGDASSAVTVALRKLHAAGVRTTVRAGSVAPSTARLWAAALAFPISPSTAARFLARLDPRILQETSP